MIWLVTTMIHSTGAFSGCTAMTYERSSDVILGTIYSVG